MEEWHINKVILIGRLTKDPELNFTTTCTAVCKFTVAVDSKYKKEGQPSADFIHVIVWGKMAESSADYLKKGKLVGVAGRIEIRSYEAKDSIKRYVTEVIADEVKFLDYGSDKNTQQNRDIPSDYFGEQDHVDDGDDMPFN